MGEIREMLSLMEQQLLDATSLEEPSFLARVSLLLKKIGSGQPTRVRNISFFIRAHTTIGYAISCAHNIVGTFVLSLCFS